MSPLALLASLFFIASAVSAGTPSFSVKYFNDSMCTVPNPIGTVFYNSTIGNALSGGQSQGTSCYSTNIPAGFPRIVGVCPIGQSLQDLDILQPDCATVLYTFQSRGAPGTCATLLGASVQNVSGIAGVQIFCYPNNAGSHGAALTGLLLTLPLLLSLLFVAKVF